MGNHWGTLGLAISNLLPQTAYMSPGRAAAVRAVQARMGELGLTQEALAVKARTDLSTVNTFLNGRTWPQVRTRARLETALEWSVGKLGRLAAGTEQVDVEQLERAKLSLLDALALDDPSAMRAAVADAYAAISAAMGDQGRVDPRSDGQAPR
jgi:transcriptional regulator with XRE-family HTH domain